MNETNCCGGVCTPQNDTPRTARCGNKWLAATIVGASLVVSVGLWSYAYLVGKSSGNVLTVTGSAEQIITSDSAKWSGSFLRTVDAAGLRDGNTQMKNDLDAILKYLRGQGVTDAEINIQPMTVNQTCEGQNNVMYDRSGGQYCGSSRVLGYNLLQGISVESGDVKKITKIAQESSNVLISQGLTFSSWNPEYYYSKLADLRLEMLGRATKDAKARAERIAQNTGSRIGKIQNASMGVFQITAVKSTQVEDYGAYDTTTIDKKVTAVVRASFSL